MADAKVALKGLEKKLEAVEEAEPLTLFQGMAKDVAKVELEDAIGNAKMEIEAAEFMVDDAETKLRIVQREVPLEVEFFGPGLTY